MPLHPTILITLHSEPRTPHGANDDWSPDAPALARAAERAPLPFVAGRMSGAVR